MLGMSFGRLIWTDCEQTPVQVHCSTLTNGPESIYRTHSPVRAVLIDLQAGMISYTMDGEPARLQVPVSQTFFQIEPFQFGENSYLLLQ